MLPFAILAVFILRGVCGFGSSYLTEYVSDLVINDLRNDLNAHIQDLSLSFFIGTPPGRCCRASPATCTGRQLAHRCGGLGAQGQRVADRAGRRRLLSGLDAGPDRDGRLSGLRAADGAHVAANAALRAQPAGSLGELTALLQETVQGNRVVKAFGMEGYEKRRFAAENLGLFRLAVRVARIRAFVTPMMEVLAAFGIAGVVWYGGYSVIVGGRTQGSFLAFLTALFLLYDPFKGLGRTNGQIQQGLAAADRVFELLDTKSDVVDRSDAQTLGPISHGIAYERVTFRYQAEAVLQDVNLTIQRGRSRGAGRPQRWRQEHAGGSVAALL